ncbi:hypothetical protein C0J52_18927 [Blattella germanica]|nr:hypothetical protein C0J52_18927 [Blattella germanica]
MSKTLFLYPHYWQIYQSYATESSTPSLRSTWIHFSVWDELYYWLHICRVTRGAYIEHL